jgi:hypothetical protein
LSQLQCNRKERQKIKNEKKPERKKGIESIQRSGCRRSTALWNVATNKISGIIGTYLSPFRLLPATVPASIGGGGDRWLYKPVWM